MILNSKFVRSIKFFVSRPKYQSSLSLPNEPADDNESWQSDAEIANDVSLQRPYTMASLVLGLVLGLSAASMFTNDKTSSGALSKQSCARAKYLQELKPKY